MKDKILNMLKAPVKLLARLLSPIARTKPGRWFVETVTNKEIMGKIGVTLFIIIIYRALASIPLPGVDMAVYDQYFGKSTASEVNYLFTIFTGGRVDTPSLVGLGIAAYINASIIMQMLPYAIPRLKEIQKDGERGRQVINQITRFITLPLSLFYSVVYLMLISQRDLANQLNDPLVAGDPNHVPVYLIQHMTGSQWPSIQKIILMTVVLAAGTMLLMWLSEIITERGIGNGSSIIITIGILSSLPVLLTQDFANINFNDVFTQLSQGNFSVLNSPLATSLFAVLIGGVLVIAGIIFVNESVRNIAVAYARRVRGAEIGKGSYLPLKFTLTGVLPIIFTYAVLSIPQLLIPLLENSADKASGFYQFLQTLKTGFIYAPTDNVVNNQDAVYAVVYFILVIIFGLFYSFIVLNPQETAENLQKSGAFVPGVRPGKETEKYLANVLLRISFVGAIFLALIAEIPIIARDLVLNNSGANLHVLSGIGGTSVLILVGVLLDTIRQFNSLKATKSYEKYALT